MTRVKEFCELWREALGDDPENIRVSMFRTMSESMQKEIVQQMRDELEQSNLVRSKREESEHARA